jgi:arylsulfatase A-like enzyme
MNRREFVASLGAAVGAATLDARAETTPPASAKSGRPNLVYVFADQLRYSACGYAGDEYARTPNIDRLAAQSCNVHEAISSTPVCAPYRASLMTGKYQSSTGMVINEIRLSPEHRCFGHVLTEGGYRTGYIGKWHMWANQLGHHDLVKNGFVPPGPYRLGFDGYWAGYNYNHRYVHSPYFTDNADPHLRPDFEPDGQTDRAIRFVKDNAHEKDPFALFLSWGPPHPSWGMDNVQPQYADLFRDKKIPLRPNYTTRQDPYGDAWDQLPKNPEVIPDLMKAYYAQTANLDWNLGRLMEALEEAGVADNTILVFTSDHGEMFGSHGRMAKLIFYEEAARIPFLVRWPKKIPEKTVSDVLLGTPDIMPTLLSMMGLPIPTTVEGKDLSASVIGGHGEGNEIAHLQGMGATASWTDGSEWRAARDNQYTYGVYHRDGKELLFDRRRDPYQLTNLAEDPGFASTLAHYRTTSQLWRAEQNDTFEACSWYQRWTVDRNIVNTARGVTQDLDALNRLTARWLPNGIGEHTVSPYPVG